MASIEPDLKLFGQTIPTRTHEKWSDAQVICGDIAKIETGDIPDADVLLSGSRKIDDAWNKLYKQYVRVVKAKKPEMFAAENVKGILTMGEGRVINAILREFSDCGYAVFYKLLNAKDYEAPQDRERVIIVGFRRDLKVQKLQFPPPRDSVITLREALKNMPESAPDEVCQAPYSSRYMSRNRKRSWDEVSYTIPAMAKQVPLWSGSPDMVKIDKDHWKFGENGITRRFSWREAAAIQTFPPDLKFAGNLTSRYQQIGNAVPRSDFARNAEKIPRKPEGFWNVSLLRSLLCTFRFLGKRGFLLPCVQEESNTKSNPAYPAVQSVGKKIFRC